MAAVVVALGLFVFMWSSGTSPHLIAAWSGFALLYFLFAAPTVCGAYTRAGGRCRNNVQGVLRGCHIRQHGKAKRARLLRDGIGRPSWAYYGDRRRTHTDVFLQVTDVCGPWRMGRPSMAWKRSGVRFPLAPRKTAGQGPCMSLAGAASALVNVANWLRWLRRDVCAVPVHVGHGGSCWWVDSLGTRVR